MIDFIPEIRQNLLKSFFENWALFFITNEDYYLILKECSQKIDQIRKYIEELKKTNSISEINIALLDSVKRLDKLKLNYIFGKIIFLFEYIIINELAMSYKTDQNCANIQNILCNLMIKLEIAGIERNDGINLKDYFLNEIVNKNYISQMRSAIIDLIPDIESEEIENLEIKIPQRRSEEIKKYEINKIPFAIENDSTNDSSCSIETPKNFLLRFDSKNQYISKISSGNTKDNFKKRSCFGFKPQIHSTFIKRPVCLEVNPFGTNIKEAYTSPLISKICEFSNKKKIGNNENNMEVANFSK